MPDDRKCDIIIAGVGGQGVLLCSDILGEASIIEGLPVRGAEVHGMSQRGGSVEAHARIGCVYGPRIPAGKADILIAMEPLEGARFSHYLKNDGFAAVNTSPIPLLGKSYDVDRMIEILEKRTANIVPGNFSALAEKTGSIKVLNILMLGIASVHIPLAKESFVSAIKKSVKEKFLGMNLEALNSGIGISA